MAIGGCGNGTPLASGTINFVAKPEAAETGESDHHRVFFCICAFVDPASYCSNI